MNAKQRIIHELYQRKVAQLNEVSSKLRARQDRCNDLHERMNAAAKKWNLELAEAYGLRIEQHQKPIDELAQEALRLKNELEKIPRVWIA